MRRDAARRPFRRALPPVVAGLAVFAALQVVRRLADRPEQDPAVEEDPLSFPELLGCWELDAGGWTLAGGGAAAPSANAGPAADAAVPSLPPLLVLPDRILLLPDSIDEWRRAERTYRAVPVAGGHDGRLAASLRWFPRGDTLWLVWSDGLLRAGLALRRADERLAGAGRALRPGNGGVPSLDARVAARAWKVNCATGLRDIPRRGPRP